MQGSTDASTSSSTRPAFIFSYNSTDPDLPPRLLAPAPPSSSTRHSYARPHQQGGDDDDDDWVPTYGPTTYRRGQIKFVPAKDPQFAVLQGTTGEVGFSIEENGTLDRLESTNVGGPKTKTPAADGSEIRNLYASIVGLGSSATGAMTRSAPESRRDSLALAAPGSNKQHEEPPRKRPRTVSPPPAQPTSGGESLLPQAGASSRTEPTLYKDQDELADIVLSSDDDGDDDDDDLVIIDPLTGQPESRSPKRAAAQPLLIHQLLPTVSEAREKPFVPPLQYGIKSDSPGWRLLARQGWKEGAPLGPVIDETAAVHAHPDAALADDRLKVPLRAVEKRDRGGIGLASSSSSSSATGLQNKLVVGALGTDLSRRAREERERERRKAELALHAKRGKGERGMERMRKKEERERKAWIAYMNR